MPVLATLLSSPSRVSPSGSLISGGGRSDQSEVHENTITDRKNPRRTAITKTPSVLAQSADVRKTEDAAIAKYNGLIATRLAAFEQANSGVEATIIDTAAPFNTAINNPTAYGAPNAVCYNEDGTSCLWFNDYHPGVAINKLVAQAVADAWHGSFF